MHDLMERYLAAVASHFFGKKKDYVYNNLKASMMEHMDDYENIEDLIISFGHPRSMAYNYGYKPYFIRIYNKYYIVMFEKLFFTISFLYLFISALFYLNELDCLSFIIQSNSPLNIPNYINWILSNPIFILILIAVILYLLFLLVDKRHPVNQDYDMTWTRKELEHLPHPAHYPDHLVDTNLIIIFSIYFIIFNVFFSSSYIIEVQNLTHKMIHLMVNFFQPFMTITLMVYLLDITKKKYSKKYLKYTIFIDLFTLTTLTIFVVNTNLLEEYLLPLHINSYYLVVNIMVICALFFLFFFASYNICKNIKHYKYLYKK